MNREQAALALLRRLDLQEDSANVIINDSAVPCEFTVLIFTPEKHIKQVTEWYGHPVRVIFAGGPPQTFL